MFYTAYPKCPKRDPRPGTLSGSRDPKCRTHLIGETRVPRPGILKVGLKTQDPYYTWEPRPSILKVKPGTIIIGETQYQKQTSLFEPGTQEL